jgi:hypothetical protein
MNKALLVGINSYPTAPLNGCVNDVFDMADFLIANCGFQKSEITIVTDGRATKRNIVDQLARLINGVTAEDRIIFHFSGHGVQLPTLSPIGEVDGLDEAICPYDFNWTDETTIRDKDFHQIFSVVPPGTLFTWVSDSCHSGDLFKFISDDSKEILFKTIPPPSDIQWQLDVAKEKGVKRLNLREIADQVNVLLVSGCNSNELSADARIDGRYNGALTYYLLDTMNNTGKNRNMQDIVSAVNNALDHNGYDQNPQLEGNHALMGRAFLS